LYIPIQQYEEEISMKNFIKVMKALSDPNRVKIVKMLQGRTMCVCEIQIALGVAQPTASNHLKLLEDAGLVGFKKERQWVNYYVAAGNTNPYSSTLLGNLRHWLQDDPEIVRITANLAEVRREEICRKPSFSPPESGLLVADDSREAQIIGKM
jgi:ArsR family transcriptional regulator, arsenate/arsenite/antimonite-responsive transcriptional repressor